MNESKYTYTHLIILRQILIACRTAKKMLQEYDDLFIYFNRFMFLRVFLHAFLVSNEILLYRYVETFRIVDWICTVRLWLDKPNWNNLSSIPRNFMWNSV